MKELDKNTDINKLSLEELQKRVELFKKEGKSLSMDDRLLVRDMVKKIDKLNSPVESSKVFVGDKDKDENQLVFVPIDKIFSGHDTENVIEGELKDRLTVDKKAIEELAASIDKIGLLQPIVVRDMGDGTFRKVNGWRRIEASKLLGRKKIKAIVKKETFDLENHNLSILHENTQRKGLNAYEKISAVFHMLKQSMNVKDDVSMRKLCTQANNLNKGNIKFPTEEQQENLDKIQKVLSDVKVYTSLSHLVKHLNLLDMDPNILNYLTKGNISFKTAEKLHMCRKTKWTKPWEYSSVIENVGESEMTLDDLVEFIAENSGESKKGTQTISTIFSKMKKSVSKLPTEKKKEFESEMKGLYSKYFKQ